MEKILGTKKEKIKERLQGRGDGLRKSKPKTDKDNGLIQYLWRMAAFHSGQNTSMPVTASFWLQDYLEDKNINARVSGVLDDEGKKITSKLEDVTTEILNDLGEPTTAAAKRWKKLLA